ncbi:lipid-binding SYLF domain-containing protein [Roseomonas sp. E05]|uniref:lipid-binding SYLF domain-containing protein n=1 Tax=Roseomonas sp. E05 TaxID=3046310 RepID=UPI0024BA52BA|nr:lipid-binding SYLF domain-containing protein [Roseomonas sp. E05]MDJ0386625.1 lipid-binding SYLF domain-containing protein [Roseomonas sp. E05]
MRQFIFAAMLFATAALGAVATARPAVAQVEQQALVDRSTLAMQEMLGAAGGANAAHFNDAITLLRRARAVMICPRVFRAGFIFGGQGGSCVLLARDGAGSWSSPAFYGMGSGSIGFQIGVQDAMVMMVILTDKGLSALMDSQFKIGADASIAVATIGGGIAGSTTAAVGADIVTFAKTRGLFAGIALDGSLLSGRSDWNRAYYGQSYGARQIVVDMAAHNPGADPLRAVLMRFGSPNPQAAPQQSYAPQQGYQPPPGGGVQAEPLR